MKNRRSKVLAVCLVTLCGVISGTFAGIFKHISIDGSFGDWAGVPLAATQAQLTNILVPFKEIYVANDEDYLYLRFSLYSSANPFTSKQNIFLDANNNGATGYSAHGIGSEMLIQSGTAYRETNGIFNAGTITGLSWQASPSAPGNEFEVRISRNAAYTNGAPVFTNNTIALILESDETGGATWFPSASGGIPYTFSVASNTVAGQDFVTNSYTASSEDYANPERGFYLQADNYASAPSAVPSNLANYRNNGMGSPGNVYTAKISLLLRLFYLDSFVSAPISSNFLNSIQADFDSIRAQGDKVIVRFAYNKDTTRPFDEPTKAQILAHIEQLKPLLRKNSDVIAVLQMGMIAAWGEGYYTDVFYTNGQATPQNWLDRIAVLNALLDALPAERMVQVRVPQFKQKFVYGTDAPTSSAPIISSVAFSGSNIARVGFHNDCYLASSTDYGTFSDYDYGAGTSAQDTANLRNYLAQETRFAPMGGETCAVNPPATDCGVDGVGGADGDMAISHYSFLNQSYNVDVNNQWVPEGCMETIKRRLGYRLQLVSGIFRTEAQPGQAIPLTLQFTNTGYASLFNPRGLELVLRNNSTGRKFFANLSRDTDARRWLPGTDCVLNARLLLPSDMPPGDYEMLLNLPDPAPSLYGNTAYSIRLANSNAVSSAGDVLNDIWEAATGYHRLGLTLTINATATNAPDDGTEIPALGFSVIAETYNTWKTRNFPLNPQAGAPDADPDGDGRVNLLEYAIGSNPNLPDTDNYLKVSVLNGDLLLSVQKGLGVKDIDYEIESSSSLSPAIWSTSSVAILYNDASMLSASCSGTAQTGFLRLKISPK